jgi:hypothetical protein
MNAGARSFLHSTVYAGLALVLAGTPVAVSAAQPDTANPTPSAMAAAEKNAPYPTFASVPPTPKDVRSLQAWKTAILDIRRSGADLGSQAAAERWTLSDTEGFAAKAHAEATPPAPVTSALDPDTAAKVAEMRARAKEPPRSR